MKHITFTTFLILIISVQIQAQETWTLPKCIDYALQNNIDIKTNNNRLLEQEINLFESKSNLLPNINSGGGINMNYGRNIDGTTNNITYNQTLTNNYWISSSIDIFQGFVKHNTIKYNKFLLSATNEDALVFKNKLVFDVITLYYTVIYSIEIKDVAQGQVDLSQKQYNRMQKLVEVGKESPITSQKLKSVWIADKLNLTIANNNLKKSLLDLKQLLKFNEANDFEIDSLNINNFVKTSFSNIDSIYNTAVNILPEIKQQEYLLQASIKDLAIAKGSVLPRIYLSAAVYTNYFEGDVLTYSQQFKNNQNQQINMGIVIPIFNNASTYCKIKRKEIEVNDRVNEITRKKDILYSEIWKAVEDLESAEEEYKSSVELLTSCELTLKNTTKKLELGLANTTDYEVSKQRFATVKGNLIKAKTIYVMRKQILEFYKTGNWEHL